MSYQHQEICVVKPDPTLIHDDQEDILMSYLNSDYMSSSVTSTWTTTNHQQPTPNSTPTYGQSPVSTPDSRHNYYDIAPSTDSWSQQPSTPTTENYTQPILNDFSLLISNHYQQEPIIPCNSTQMLYNQLQYHHTQPASPPGSSNSVCSTDSGQSKKRRGRKKRDSCNNISPSRSVTVNIAPAVPAIKHLATILPAQNLNSQRSTSNSLGATEDKYGPIPTAVSSKNNKCVEPISRSIASPNDAVMNSQKAAIIAKRQERLIKNRAAALLSRKRKREHLTALEDQRNGLVSENNSLKNRVMDLEKANLDLKKRLESQQNNDNKSVMMFMLIIFFFAYFVSGATKMMAVKHINKNTANANLPYLTKTTTSHSDSSTSFRLSPPSYNDDDEKR